MSVHLKMSWGMIFKIEHEKWGWASKNSTMYLASWRTHINVNYTLSNFITNLPSCSTIIILKTLFMCQRQWHARTVVCCCCCYGCFVMFMMFNHAMLWSRLSAWRWNSDTDSINYRYHCINHNPEENPVDSQYDSFNTYDRWVSLPCNMPIFEPCRVHTQNALTSLLHTQLPGTLGTLSPAA